MKHLFTYLVICSLFLVTQPTTTGPTADAYRYFKTLQSTNRDAAGFVKIIKAFNQDLGQLKAGDESQRLAMQKKLEWMQNLRRTGTFDATARQHADMLIRYAQAKIKTPVLVVTKPASKPIKPAEPTSTRSLRQALELLSSKAYENKHAAEILRKYNDFVIAQQIKRPPDEQIPTLFDLYKTAVEEYRSINTAESEIKQAAHKLLEVMRDVIAALKRKKDSPATPPKKAAKEVPAPTPSPRSASKKSHVAATPKPTPKSKPQPIITAPPEFLFEDGTTAENQRELGELKATLRKERQEKDLALKVVNIFYTFEKLTNPTPDLIRKLITQLEKELKTAGTRLTRSDKKQAISRIIMIGERFKRTMQEKIYLLEHPKAAPGKTAKPPAAKRPVARTPSPRPPHTGEIHIPHSILKTSGRNTSPTSSPAKNVKTTDRTEKTPRKEIPFKADEPIALSMRRKSSPRPATPSHKKSPKATTASLTSPSSSKATYIRVPAQNGVDCAFHVAQNAYALASFLTMHGGIFNATQFQPPSKRAILYSKEQFVTTYSPRSNALNEEEMRKLLLATFDHATYLDGSYFFVEKPHYACAEVDKASQDRLANVINHKNSEADLQHALQAAKATPLLDLAIAHQERKNLILAWQLHTGKHSEIGHWITILVTPQNQLFLLDSLNTKHYPSNLSSFVDGLKRYPVETARVLDTIAE